ncbi:Dot/Icm T4SS effector Lem28 [Legionella pneumophila]|nr:Dot/Icm T4SS effector Lem28 [Legionella pneumophila]
MCSEFFFTIMLKYSTNMLELAMPKINKIVNGTDLTPHYLSEPNKEFKIYRYNNEVYAVRFENDEPIDYVLMWKSHKSGHTQNSEMIKNTEEDYKELGKGEQGTVYEKTEDKAMKVSRGRHPREFYEEINLHIIEQQFFLKYHGIQEHFVLGLWNIKNEENVYFYMPKINAIPINKKIDQPKIEEFVLALKELNDAGYWHPDLANNPYHISPQNLIATEEMVKTIDLDGGFRYDKGRVDDLSRKSLVYGKDQWLYVYNFIYPPTDEEDNRIDWRVPIEKWYENNRDESLSDNPHTLLRFYHEGLISLPKKLAHDLHETILEELSQDKKFKKHSHEVGVNRFFSPKKQEIYEGLKGDGLKKVILKELRDSLAEIRTMEQLEEKKLEFLASPEMQILAEGQDKTTKALNLKTSSRKKVMVIFKEAEERILNSPNVSI